jgi:SAM-dependent methyltransferase
MTADGADGTGIASVPRMRTARRALANPNPDEPRGVASPSPAPAGQASALRVRLPKSGGVTGVSDTRILRTLADYPVALSADLETRLARAFDVEGKIARALDALSPILGTDVVLVNGAQPGGLRERQLSDLGARLRVVTPSVLASPDVADGSTDTLVSCWSWFRDDLAADLAAAERVLRDGGRLLVVHDYGRDDVSRLRQPDLPEYTSWSRRDGWFLRTGFKVRVIHCWWTFDTIEDAGSFLGDAFADAGRTLATGLKRPRLSYNVAIYHWTKGGGTAA